MKLELYLSMVDSLQSVGEVLDFLQIVCLSDLQPCQFSALCDKAFDHIKELRGVCV